MLAEGSVDTAAKHMQFAVAVAQPYAVAAAAALAVAFAQPYAVVAAAVAAGVRSQRVMGIDFFAFDLDSVVEVEPDFAFEYSAVVAVELVPLEVLPLVVHFDDSFDQSVVVAAAASEAQAFLVAPSVGLQPSACLEHLLAVVAVPLATQLVGGLAPSSTVAAAVVVATSVIDMLAHCEFEWLAVAGWVR